MDPHAVLGVSADADDEAIAGAYRKLAKRFHPDHRPEDEGAALRMAEINTAYALLRDSQAEMLARRRVGELRVLPRSGRRVSFSELEPAALRLVLLGARRHVPA